MTGPLSDEAAIAEFLAEWHEQMAHEFRKLAGTSQEGLADSRRAEPLSTSMPATATATPTPTATPTSPAAPDRPLLSQQQLADRLGCNVRTLRRWTHEGLIPAPITIGNVRRWDPAVIDAFVRERSGSARGRLSARVSHDRGRGRRGSRGGPP